MSGAWNGWLKIRTANQSTYTWPFTAWTPQGRLIFSMSPKQEYSSEQGGNCMAFYDPPSRVSQYHFCQLYWPKQSQACSESMGIRLPLLMGEMSSSHCTRAWGMRDTVVASSGKYHLPQSLRVQGTELPYQPQPPSLEFEWEIHFWLVSGTLIFGLSCSEDNPVLTQRSALYGLWGTREKWGLFSHPPDLVWIWVSLK